MRSSDDFEPRDVAFRVVNTLDEPVDIYVRTSGLVEAFPIADGVESGAVTDPVSPPTDGVFLVTRAGAGDPTCVSGCDHFMRSCRRSTIRATGCRVAWSRSISTTSWSEATRRLRSPTIPMLD